MKEFTAHIRNNIYPIIFILLLVLYRGLLLILESSVSVIPQRVYFTHIIPWGNFDGMHYLSIAEKGYVQFEQAFFPLFPLSIHALAELFHIHYFLAGTIMVYAAVIVAAVLLFELALVDLKHKQAVWALLFFLSFPSAFFIFGIYTEALFLVFVFGSFLLMRKKSFLGASILAGFASATRIVGIFILPALLFELYKREKKFTRKYFFRALALSVVSLSGFFAYCGYLWKSYGDPLLFLHSQTAFGAGRSGGEIILLPQVMWRYFKIFITVPPSSFDWWVSLLEVIIFIIVTLGLYIAYKKKVRASYIIFSVCALAFPTLSGTLSSIPRYALVCFAIYFGFSNIPSKFVRILIIILSIIIQVVLCALFLRGYFIS